MILEADYDKLQAELTAIEAAHNVYLADQSVDAENLPEGIDASDPEYWSFMYSAACMAAGQRAEALGLNINALLGRTIY